MLKSTGDTRSNGLQKMSAFRARYVQSPKKGPGFQATTFNLSQDPKRKRPNWILSKLLISHLLLYDFAPAVCTQLYGAD